MSSTRFKETHTFTSAGESADSMCASILTALKMTPATTTAQLLLGAGEPVEFEVVSSFPMLALRATCLPGRLRATSVNVTICVSEVPLGNSSVANSAVISLEAIVLASDKSASDVIMADITKQVQGSSKSKTAFLTDSRSTTPMSVISPS